MRYVRVGFLTVLLLGGCAGQPLVYNEQLSHAYRPTEYGYGAGGRDFTTVIRGDPDPFQVGEEAFQAQFVDLLNRHQPILQPTHFTTTPGPSARPIYRAVFLFNAEGLLPNRMCAQPLDVPTVDLGDRVRVTAAFCRWQGYLSTVTGEVAAEGIDDPRFESMIGQMIFLLFPPVDPTEQDSKIWIVTERQGDGAVTRVAGAGG